MYLEAPWPIGSDSKAERNFKKTVEPAPELLQPRYWLAVIELNRGNDKAASDYLEYVIKNRPPDLRCIILTLSKKKRNQYFKSYKKKKIRIKTKEAV